LSHFKTTDSVGQLFLGAPNWEEQAHGKSRSPLGVQKNKQQLRALRRVNFANERCAPFN